MNDQDCIRLMEAIRLFLTGNDASIILPSHEDAERMSWAADSIFFALGLKNPESDHCISVIPSSTRRTISFMYKGKALVFTSEE